MKRKMIAALMCGMVALMPVTALADEKDDRIAELEAQLEQLQADYDQMESNYNEAMAILEEWFGGIEDVTEAEATLETDQEEIGEGTITLSTAGGTSEDGNVPVVYVEPNTTLLQIGFDAWDFDGSLLSYIYIDGSLNDSRQLASTQSVLDLSGSALEAGVHVVSVVQYADDDEAGEIVTYKSASYEIKEQ